MAYDHAGKNGVRGERRDHGRPPRRTQPQRSSGGLFNLVSRDVRVREGDKTGAPAEDVECSLLAWSINKFIDEGEALVFAFVFLNNMESLPSLVTIAENGPENIECYEGMTLKVKDRPWNLHERMGAPFVDKFSYLLVSLRRKNNLIYFRFKFGGKYIERTVQLTSARHLFFGLVAKKEFVAALSQRDLAIWLLVPLEERAEGPYAIKRGGVCFICQEQYPTTVVVYRRCGHVACSTCDLSYRMTDRRNQGCSVCDRREGEPAQQTKGVQGYLYDSYCAKDKCMERSVLNLPCGCISCGEPTKPAAAECQKGAIHCPHCAAEVIERIKTIFM